MAAPAACVGATLPVMALDRPDPDDARVRDMPGPRDNPGLASPALQRAFVWPYRAVLAGFYRAGFKPWHLTMCSLAFHIVAGLLLLQGQRLVPGLLLIPAGLFDIFDGGVARLRGEESRAGAYLDSVMDRVSDLIVFGCLFVSLASEGEELQALLALIALGFSLGVSFVRAQAEAAGVALTEGLFQRTERFVVTILGLVIPGALPYALALLAILGGFTFVQRLWMGYHRIDR